MGYYSCSLTKVVARILETLACSAIERNRKLGVERGKVEQHIGELETKIVLRERPLCIKAQSCIPREVHAYVYRELAPNPDKLYGIRS